MKLVRSKSPNNLLLQRDISGRQWLLEVGYTSLELARAWVRHSAGPTGLSTEATREEAGVGMIKGVFLALGIMFGCLLIPLVHFVAFPASPFIGGYFGIKFAQVPRESYAAKCLLFGAILGALFLVLASLATALVVTLSDLGQRFLVIIWIGVVVLTL